MNALPIHADFMQTLLEVHWAAQIPASASRLVDAQPDWSHTNLLFEGGLLLGRPLPDGRRAGIDPLTLSLMVGDERLPLEGCTLQDGFNWLSERLGVGIEFFEHVLPTRPVDKPLRLHGAEGQLQAWFAMAQKLLQPVADAESGSEVRIWPHHFDAATLIDLDESGEESRSINVGLSPGDGTYAEPYWYVTPWPGPFGPLPDLSFGAWHTDGFTAAVLPASQHDPQRAEEYAASFLRESVAACRSILGGES